MKKLLILMILLPLVAFGQTRPHWLQIQGAPVTDVRTLGADPTGATDSTAAIYEAIEAGGYVYIPPGNYKMTASVGFTGHPRVSKATTIMGYGARLFADNTQAGRFRLLPIDIVTNDNVFVGVYGLELDGNNHAGMGLVVRTLASVGGPEDAVVDIRDCRVHRLVGDVSTATTRSQSGIYIQNKFKRVHIENNIVDDVLRPIGAEIAVAFGIAVSSIPESSIVRIIGNTVTNVRGEEGGVWRGNAIIVYGDGVVAETTLGIDNVVISGNIIKDFGGRGIKTQTPYVTIKNNYFAQITRPVMPGGVFIDLQAGGGLVIGNRFFIHPDVSFTSENGRMAALIRASMRYSFGLRNVTIEGNTFDLGRDDQRLSYGVLCVFGLGEDGANESIRIVNNHHLRGTYSLFARTEMPDTYTIGSSTLEVSGNTFEHLGYPGGADYLVRHEGTYMQDRTRSLNMHTIVTNNILRRTPNLVYPFAARPPGATPDGQFSGRVTIHGNSGFDAVRFKELYLHDVQEGSDFRFRRWEVTDLGVVDVATGAANLAADVHVKSMVNAGTRSRHLLSRTAADQARFVYTYFDPASDTPDISADLVYAP